MKKKAYILGIAAGIGTWLACLTGAETLQYILALATLIAFWISDRAGKRIEDTD